MRNSAYDDFNDKSLDDIRFKKLNSYPTISENAPRIFYVDQKL